VAVRTISLVKIVHEHASPTIIFMKLKQSRPLKSFLLTYLHGPEPVYTHTHTPSHTHTHRFIAAWWLDWTNAIKKNKTKI